MSAAPLRSLLFVPGDSERKQAKGLATGADALILDLEDSVAEERRPVARAMVLELLQGQGARARQQLWVRVNALSSGRLFEDLAAVLPGRPAGIVLPKVDSYDDIERVARALEALEAGQGLLVGSTPLLVIATETPAGLLSLPGYPQAVASHSASARRLAGLTWGMEDLSAALGARVKTDGAGVLRPAFQLARTSCLLVAAAIGVPSIDGVYVDFRDAGGLRREAEEARGDGFSGKLAIHPDQIETINAAFTPTEAETAWARRVLAAFEAAVGAGVTQLEGRMIDRPHLLQAQRILQSVSRHEGKTP
jgi:citrate lyase subunit beta/citryl-CoA lyase